MTGLNITEHDDRERLRSYGYDRLALIRVHSDPALASADFQHQANYGSAISINADGKSTSGSLVKMISEMMIEAATALIDIRDGGSTMFNANASTDYGHLINFGMAWLKGYFKIPITTATPTSLQTVIFTGGGLTNDKVGPIDGFDDVADVGVNLSHNGWPHKMRKLGYMFGRTAARIPTVTSIASLQNTGKNRMIFFEILKDFMIIPYIYPLAAIQSEVALINLGRLKGVIPSEFDMIAENSVHERWKYLFENRYPNTDLDTNAGRSMQYMIDSAGFLPFDFDDLPTATLDDLLKKRNRTWKVPARALEIARSLFGFSHSDWDFDTEVLMLFQWSSEANIDSNKVGYSLWDAMWWLDEWNRSLDVPLYFEEALNGEHWTFKNFKAKYKGYWQEITLSAFKGYSEGNLFPAQKWFTRTNNHTKTNGYYSTQHHKDVTDPGDHIAERIVTRDYGTSSDSPSRDDKYTLYIRGEWSIDQIKAFILYETLFKMGAESDTVDINVYSLYAGRHYYTRLDKTINYVTTLTGQANHRIGSYILAFSGTAANDDLQDQVGITIVDITAAFTARDINSRLPSKQYPKPKIVEQIAEESVITDFCNLVFGSSVPHSGSSASVNENENSNEADE